MRISLEKINELIYIHFHAPTPDHLICTGKSLPKINGAFISFNIYAIDIKYLRVNDICPECVNRYADYK